MPFTLRLLFTIGYWRGLWTRSVARVLCHYGHHDYEFDGLVDANPNYGKLICFYCEARKQSYKAS